MEENGKKILAQVVNNVKTDVKRGGVNGKREKCLQNFGGKIRMEEHGKKILAQVVKNIETDVERGRVILCGMNLLARHLVRTAVIIPVT